MALICRLLALAVLASAKEKKVIGPTSKLQLRCTPGTDEHDKNLTASECVKGHIKFAYDESEASLGAILAFNVYGDYRVAGGTILDSFRRVLYRGFALSVERG